MNNRTLIHFISILCFVMMIGNTANGQVRPGIKFGISTPDVTPEDILVTGINGEEYYRILVENARYGVHAGAFIQMQIGGFFIQPEILYNSSSIDYRVDSLFAPGAGSDYFRDNYKNIDFPIMMGLKTGPLRLGAGPVGHIFLSDGGGFNEYDNFEAFFEDLTWGWQAGLGLDLWKLHIDVRYEGNFSRLGDQISFFGRKFDFATNNNRFITSLGFSF